MNITKNIKTGVIVALFASAASHLCADTIGYWNFNTLSIATASAPGAGGVPTSIAASSGVGSIALSSWTGLVDDFAGSTLNALNGDTAVASLSLVSSAGNASFIELAIDLSGYQDIVLSFATRGTSTGYNSGVWSYSLDGVGFTILDGVNTASTSTSFTLVAADFSAVSALDGDSSAFFRYTLDGASSASGNNRIDNLIVSGTAVPEPSAYAAIMGGLVLAGVAVRRRRVTAKQPV